MDTLGCDTRHETVIKKSRFMAVATRVDAPDAAMQALASLRDANANHNCWAYKIGMQQRYADDGEPSGTAGKPIFAAIDGQRFDHVLVVVTRIFGGIKLGTGGLVRAYGGTAAACLRQAPRERLVTMVSILIEAPFSSVHTVHQVMGRFDVCKKSMQHALDGAQIEAQVDQRSLEDFVKAVEDATRGTCRVRSQG